MMTTTKAAAATGTPTVKPAALGQVGMSVRDLETMTAFYRDKLGLPFLFAAPGMSFFDLGGVRLMLSLPEPGHEQRHGSILYLRVADIRAAHAGLVAAGVVFEGVPHAVHRAPTHELWLAFFRDPEENVMALMSEVPVTTG
jgi:methylmalonyl-CoA/ethylmalonyl-CoA epimerase